MTKKNSDLRSVYTTCDFVSTMLVHSDIFFFFLPKKVSSVYRKLSAAL
jgi:hypothetical protein